MGSTFGRGGGRRTTRRSGSSSSGGGSSITTSMTSPSSSMSISPQVFTPSTTSTSTSPSSSMSISPQVFTPPGTAPTKPGVGIRTGARAGRGRKRDGAGQWLPLSGIWYGNVFRGDGVELTMPIRIQRDGADAEVRAVLNPDGTVSALPDGAPKKVKPVKKAAYELSGDFGRGDFGRGDFGRGDFGRGDFGRGDGSLSVAQQAMAATITRVMQARGVPPEVIQAAIVNAVAESGLNPSAVGDGGKSVGLFQLHERGAGSGMSVADRKDPVKNTNRIVDTYLGSQGKPMRAAYAAGERRVSELAALWSANVERPADRAGEMAKRAALALRMFPASGGGTVTDAMQTVTRAVWPRYLLGGAAILLAVAGAIRWKAHADRKYPAGVKV